MVRRRDTMSVGRLTALRTMTVVTSPADGIPAAPTAAKVAVIAVTMTCPKFREIPLT